MRAGTVLTRLARTFILCSCKPYSLGVVRHLELIISWAAQGPAVALNLQGQCRTAFLWLAALACTKSRASDERRLTRLHYYETLMDPACIQMPVSEGAQAAIAGIVEASNDTVTLAAAIEAASFLDAFPGEDRQKLRGEQSGIQAIPC